MEGCVPEWRRYVPGRRLLQGSHATLPPAPSVASERTRSGWAGGAKTVSPGFVVPSVPGQVVPCAGCAGLGAVVLSLPRPPPSWPSTTSEVGTLFAAPLVENVRRFVRLT